MKTRGLHISTISELHRLNKLDMPLHPLLSIHRIEDLPSYAEKLYSDFSLGFYTIGLKQNVTNVLKMERESMIFKEVY